MTKKFDQTVVRTNRWIFAVKLGFFAGLIWGAVKIMFYYLGFTKVLPAFLVEPFFVREFMNSWSGHLVGWLFFTLFSIAASVLYAAFLYKVKGPWPGVAYGLIWWALLYLWIGPITGMMKRIDRLDWNSILSDASLFVLWGVFIGYTIAIEFTDETIREPFKK
jgi:uncharacterized membrane protein YagU involved in acid resistance